MAYSKEVVDRFEKVLENPKDFAVGKFDPQALECSNSYGRSTCVWRCYETTTKTK